MKTPWFTTQRQLPFDMGWRPASRGDLDVTDPELQAAQLLGAANRSDSVRAARLAALQTAAVKTSAERGLRRMLTFHYLTSETEPCGRSAGSHQAAVENDPTTFPEPERVWRSWLCGERSPAHSRKTPGAFAAQVGGVGG
jgi:hypothetical protein